MIVASLSRVSKEFHGKVVLNEVSLEIKTGARIGLVGENGTGKSTLLRLLAGEEEADEGVVARRKDLQAGYLMQHARFDADRTVYEIAHSASDTIASINARLEAVERKLSDETVLASEKELDRVLHEQADLIEAFGAAGGYSYPNKVQSVLGGLRFGPDRYDQAAATLSGGEKKLLQLARLLIREPELLLLDEPDNHLDLDGKQWLAEYILAHEGAVLIVTHDRFLLDQIATQIIELEDGQAHLYHGNYTHFVTERQARLERLQEEYDQHREVVQKLEEQTRQLKLWASMNPKFARRAESRMKMLERAKERIVERPMMVRKTIDLSFKSDRSGVRVVDVCGVSKSIGNRTLMSNVNFSIRYGARMGIIGPNGSGKSTLLKMIAGAVQPDAGEIKIGASVRPGYYSQEQERLPLEMTPLDWVKSLRPGTEQQAIGFLRKLLFTYGEMRVPMRVLSGGQKSRLHFAEMILSEANFLLLDEPTNNLDIPSAEVLEEALTEFDGTVLTVSHDRYLLDKIVTEMLVFSGDGVVTLRPGNYTEVVLGGTR